MSFLAPLFLAAAAFALGPILFHLIRRTPRQRIVFSSTELLQPSPPVITARRRIQNPWLLALRCAIVALLCFAFARPLFHASSEGPPASMPARHLVIALDESASMARAGLWDDALRQIVEQIDAIDLNDSFAIVAFADRAEQLVSPAQWRSWPLDDRRQLAKEALADRRPTRFAARLDIGVTAALEQLESMRDEQANPAVGEIALLSDFIQGAQLSGLAGLDWPDHTGLRRLQVASREETENVGLRWLGWSNEGDGQETATARLSLLRSSGQTPLQITLKATRLGEQAPAAEPLAITLGAQSETLTSIALPAAYRNEPLIFEVAGDGEPFDNRLPVAPERPLIATVQLLSASDILDTRSSAFFVAKALAGLNRPQVEFFSGDSEPPTPPQAIIVDKKLSSAEAEYVAREVERGAYALVLVREVGQASDLDFLSQTSGWKADVSNASGAMFGNIDFRHPAFAPFADPRYGDFTNVRFWRSVALTPADVPNLQIPARFDHQDPLLLEFPRGEGRIAIWAGGWSAADSQWTLSTKFVPWLNRFVSRSVGREPLPSNVIATSEAAYRYAELGPWRDANGRESATLPIDSEFGQARANNQWRWYAWQSPPSESRVGPLESAAWDRLGVPEAGDNDRHRLAEQIAQSERRESIVQSEAQQQLWRWVLALLLALLAIESIAAIRIAHASASLLSGGSKA